jgi:hypothetical protein
LEYVEFSDCRFAKAITDASRATDTSHLGRVPARRSSYEPRSHRAQPIPPPASSAVMWTQFKPGVSRRQPPRYAPSCVPSIDGHLLRSGILRLPVDTDS